MTVPEPEACRLADGGAIPNSPLPLLLYRRVLPPESCGPEGFERLFARNGWGRSWRNGIYGFHHFHSTAHEVLGIARGHVRCLMGGPGGEVFELEAGDAVLIPAGVGHCNLGASPDLLVVGAYLDDSDAVDLRRGAPQERAEVRARIAAVPLPPADPVTGRAGGLMRLWRETP